MFVLLFERFVCLSSTFFSYFLPRLNSGACNGRRIWEEIRNTDNLKLRGSRHHLNQITIVVYDGVVGGNRMAVENSKG